jgi:cation transport ATPase
METLVFKTNINCGNCVAKITPFFNQQPAIQTWQVDTKNPDKILTIEGQITENQVIELITKAGFQVKETLQSGTKNGTQNNISNDTQNNKESSFWQDNLVWKKASFNTLNCLIGCSIGDFGMIIYLQANHIHYPMWLTMLLAIIAGLFTSILLETIILQYKENLTWKQALQMALGMSLISMVAMEIAMNITDFMLTGGKADFHSHTYWLAFGFALVAGFFAPLPYNYFKLKKYNKACH